MKVPKELQGKEGLIILTIFLVAFVLRVSLIGSKIGQDEVYYVGYATDIIHGRSWSNVFPPLLEIIFVPVLLLTNQSEIAIHVFMAILGSLMVAIAYFIGKKFFNRTAGIVAAILLMLNTTQWFFSDFGMLDVPATLFALVGFYFYWNGYKTKKEKQLMLGAIFTSAAVLIRYTIFPAAAMLGFLILFDRKNLKNKMLMGYVLLPFVVWGLWMFYFIIQNGWLWNWWQSYVTGQLSINIPFYAYFQNTYDEFFLPILSFLVLFASAFLILKKWKRAQTKYNELIFIILFAVVFVFISQKSWTDVQRAEFGILTLASVFFLFFFKSDDFSKFTVIYIASVFVFFSPLGVKFPRYMMPALPVLYILAGQIFSDLRKYKALFLVGLFVIAVYSYANFGSTVSKLIVDRNINDIKYLAQQYVNQNSPQCSQVYSKTWYGFYYLRTRITDLPSDPSNVPNLVKGDCNCPPQYFVSEGSLDSRFATSGYLQKEKDFAITAKVPTFDWNGFRIADNSIIPIEIWKINSTLINSQCRTIV